MVKTVWGVDIILAITLPARVICAWIWGVDSTCEGVFSCVTEPMAKMLIFDRLETMRMSRIGGSLQEIMNCQDTEAG